MEQDNDRSNLIIKVLGSAALAGLIAVAALSWSIYSFRLSELAMEKQIAKQDIQIGLIAEQNHLQSARATSDAENASIEAQLRTPIPKNSDNFAPTATALAIQSMQVEATVQAIAARQRQIQATQTAIAQPLLLLPSPSPQPQVDMGCVGRETNAIISGASVPVSAWQSDCAYHLGVSTGTTVLLTTWGMIQEYSNSTIVSARIIPPGVLVTIGERSTSASSNFALFAGYRSYEGSDSAYRITNPNSPTPAPLQ